MQGDIYFMFDGQIVFTALFLCYTGEKVYRTVKDMNLETLCVQGGYQPKNGEPRVLPIVQSTTFKYESSEEMGKLFDLQKSGYFYTRLQNPTV